MSQNTEFLWLQFGNSPRGIAVEKTSGRKYVVISQQRFPQDPTWNYQQSECGDYQVWITEVQSIPVTSKSKHFLRSGRTSWKNFAYTTPDQSLGSCFFSTVPSCLCLCMRSWQMESTGQSVKLIYSLFVCRGRMASITDKPRSFCSSSNSQHYSWCCGRVSPLHWHNNPPPLWKLCCPFTFLTCKCTAWPMHNHSVT